MTPLQRLNLEATEIPAGLLAVRGLARACPDRFSLIVQNEHGAIELWSETIPDAAARITGDTTIGGIEVHSPTPLDDREELSYRSCDVLDGGKCWTDGSAIGYRRLLPKIEAGDTAGVLSELAAWHSAHFAAASSETTR